MEIKQTTTRSVASALVLLGIFHGANRANAQASGTNPPPASTASAGAKPDAAASHRPPRVISDLSQFHLDQLPNANAHPQVSAGSRGGISSAVILCAPSLGRSSSTRPLFQWKFPDGSSAQVTFTLLNAAGDVVYENSVTGSSLQYPADAPALAPGETYSWKVTGSAMDSLPDPVMVEIQNKDAHDAVQRKLASPDAADPLARAQVFLTDHVWYDTVAALETARREHPERKDLMEQLTKLYQQVVPACATP